jgi:hypothetical protein
MAAQLKFHKRLDLSTLPNDWKVSRVAVDWTGSPLLLIEEGKPPQPQRDAPIESIVAWFNFPPKAHHLIFWEGPSQRALTFEKSKGIITSHVQPFGEGWLLCEGRGGGAVVYDERGRTQKTLDLGDASEDVQTTPNGHIWVSYFDEGVFGNGIGQNGVVCFDSEGQPLFKYSEFAQRNQLPFVVDCYAMNVVSEEEVWLSYYSDFPLVVIRNLKLDRVWREFGCLQSGFALLGDSVISQKCYASPSELIRRRLSGVDPQEAIEAINEEGAPIRGEWAVTGRGPHLYLRNETSLYELMSAVQ